MNPRTEPNIGIVHLVGAGPGDPDLLTMRAVRLLQTADVVVYDRLISPEIMALVPNGTAKIFAGKASGDHHLRQDEINELLVRLARPGRVVVRLKGGDPYIFGRGREEAEALVAGGVACEVVPGVTAASGCAAALGIPLTHRGTASGVRFVTGHCQGSRELDHDWASLADPDTTLVVYMGLANIDQIVGELVAAGLPADTPVAAISNGTTARERLCVGTLDDIAMRIVKARLDAPMITVIGRVVDLADGLLCASEEAGEGICDDETRHRDAGA
ncbi:MAG: uroporphyrinogen-III C-methyltransferase [Alphaproteobacteria bacterium]|nr:uroporphyrinogen-III C-methyltransferase [Alphaproteobacteria bacterium]